jgi:hypothetical protein
VIGFEQIEPPTQVRYNGGAHEAWNKVIGIVCDPTIEVGEVGAAMEEDKGAMGECASDFFGIPFEDLSVPEGVQEGLKTKDVFEAFGFWKGD